ncbi:putative Polysaccharide deacetylase [Nitrospira sp. KM1]|uniref:XrtA system polysaccharide deacetylase n=1 Tax=Nitrospira sp. KM1 TaxID=1936990 RepID=UPI0013A7218A|nr:XrtA system polysaccharide deacetylase [Nitrospira sp. KM1]BCA54143.1 putative Polysaccharide deacetylase [Nitrospira sp. KM1]
MTVQSNQNLHSLSFDVEEHFQVSAFWSETRRRQWDQLESRVELNTRRLIDLLEQYETKATFFVLGWVAERHPRLVRDLVTAGHEIASHGFGHELVTSQSPGHFREDVRKAKMILEDIIGNSVSGYRAPSFSISNATAWALAILVEEGYVYDSSMYDRFQHRRVERTASTHLRIETPAGPIWEFPPSTMNLCGFQLPVAGGGYFRLLPYAASKVILKDLEKRGSQLVMYLHPWEIDPDQPRMNGPWLSQIRHYLNLKRTEDRLRQLLQDFKFAPLQNCLSTVEHALH